MKRLLFAAIFCFAVCASFAQSLPDFESIQLDRKEDYDSAANQAAWQAANYLLTTPLVKDNIPRLKSIQYIIRWMTGTPDYSFVLDEKATKFAKKSNDLLGLYMAAMTKYVLENKADSKDQEKIKLNALKMVIAYARNEQSKVKITSELKKAMAAEEKGELEAYLNI
jgi:hypothetical protein